MIRISHTIASFVAAFAALAPTTALGQAHCTDDQGFNTLDFWVGAWTVHVGDQQVGTNRIEKILDGCAVAEHWTDGRGGRGQSLFYYVAATDEWNQVWVTDRANTAGGVKEKRLIERYPDGGVRFQGAVPLADGRTMLDRTTLTPLDGGEVRQHIEISSDSGASWRTTFDAVYRPTG